QGDKVTPPRTSPYVVVGAGIHGLSTAYHLAKELRTRGVGSGADIVVLDKSSPGAGASGIACGVVRNNYFQPAMSELMQACVEVREFEFASDDSVRTVVTEEGSIEVGEQLVVAPGPWAKQFWKLLGFPPTIDVRTPDGDVVKDRPMWTYWNLQEGEIHVDPLSFATADGGAPAVIHLDTDAPLYTDDGKLVTDELWGIYFKRDRE